MNALNEELLGYTSRLCGHNSMMSTNVNRRMRENRMSGGVGGVTGAIPSPPPDQGKGSHLNQGGEPKIILYVRKFTSLNLLSCML